MSTMERATPSTVASTPDVPDVPLKGDPYQARSSSPPSAGRQSPINASVTVQWSTSSQAGSPTKGGSPGSGRKTLMKGRTTKLKQTESLGDSVGRSGTGKSEQLKLAMNSAYAYGKATSSTMAGSAAVSSRPARTPLSRRDPSECIGRLDKSLVWSACDLFSSLEKKGAGLVTRNDWIAGLADTPTVERLRMLRKSNIEARFRRNARPIRLDEFLRMIWPAFTADDFAKAKRWCELRQAWQILNHKTFDGSDRELRRVFDFLDEDRCGEIVAQDLLRAKIIPLEELKSRLKITDFKSRITLEAFKLFIQPYLRTTYVSSALQEAEQNREMDSGIGSLLAQSKR